MNRQVAVGIILLAVQLCCAARADQWPDVNQVHGLYQVCADDSLMVRKGYCFGFLHGVGEMMHMSTAMLEKQVPNPNTDWCAPPSTTGEQILQAFKNWHDRHPQQWQGLAVAGVVAALQETWPCPTTPPPAPLQNQH